MRHHIKVTKKMIREGKRRLDRVRWDLWKVNCPLALAMYEATGVPFAVEMEYATNLLTQVVADLPQSACRFNLALVNDKPLKPIGFYWKMP